MGQASWQSNFNLKVSRFCYVSFPRKNRKNYISASWGICPVRGKYFLAQRRWRQEAAFPINPRGKNMNCLWAIKARIFCPFSPKEFSTSQRILFYPPKWPFDIPTLPLRTTLGGRHFKKRNAEFTFSPSSMWEWETLFLREKQGGGSITLWGRSPFHPLSRSPSLNPVTLREK